MTAWARASLAVAAATDQVAGPKCHATAFDEASDPDRGRQVVGRQRSIEVAGGRREIATAPMDSTERHFDA